MSMDQELCISSVQDGGESTVSIAEALEALELGLKSCDESNNTIVINRKGPLLLKLRLESYAGITIPSILGFDVDENNKRGEIENDGRFSVGDICYSINGISTKNLELADVFKLLQEVGGEYRKLAFMKPLDKSKHSLSEVLAKSTPVEILDDSSGFLVHTSKSRTDSSESLIQNVHNIFVKESVMNPDTYEINYSRLQLISTSGLNDTVRCIVWSILLGCLSPLTIIDEVPIEGIGAEQVPDTVSIATPAVAMRRGGKWLEELSANFVDYDDICRDMLVLDTNSSVLPQVPAVGSTGTRDGNPFHPPGGGWCVSTLNIRPPDVPLYPQNEDGDNNIPVSEVTASAETVATSNVTSVGCDDSNDSVAVHERMSAATRGSAGRVAPGTMDSRWTVYYADLILADNIARDVTRTLPHIAFFTVKNMNSAVHIPVTTTIPDSTVREDCNNVDDNGDPPDIGAGNPLATNSHLQCIERILYVHAKLNHALRYVQGMNEIAGTLYYVMANSPVPAIREHAEAHAYHCFMSLMVEMQDLFIEEMDDSVFGVYARIRQYDALLAHTDPELHAWLVDELNIESHLYTFRWFTTLFTREFTLPDVIRIWDTLFADNDRKTFVLYIAVAMVCSLRDQLMIGDFTDNLTLLQTFPPDISVTDILQQALRLRLKDRCASSGKGQALAKRRSFVEMAATFTSNMKAYSTSNSSNKSDSVGNTGDGASPDNSVTASADDNDARMNRNQADSKSSHISKADGGDHSATPGPILSTSESLRASFSAAMGNTGISFRSAFGSMMKSSAVVTPPAAATSRDTSSSPVVAEDAQLPSTATEVTSGIDAGEEKVSTSADATITAPSADASAKTVAATSTVRSSIRSSFSQLWSRTTMLVPSVIADLEVAVPDEGEESIGRLSESDAALVSAFYKPGEDGKGDKDENNFNPHLEGDAGSSGVNAAKLSYENDGNVPSTTAVGTCTALHN